MKIDVAQLFKRSKSNRFEYGFNQVYCWRMANSRFLRIR